MLAKPESKEIVQPVLLPKTSFQKNKLLPGAESFRRTGLKKFRRIMIKSMKGKLFAILGVIAVITTLANALIAQVSALTGVNLAVGNTTISVATPCIVTFTLASAQPANEAAIVVTFGTGILVGTPVVTMQTGGATTMNLTTITADTTIAGQAATINTLNGSVAIPSLAAGTAVTLTFTKITNPADIGNYTVTVSTAAEPTAVTSNVITTTATTATALPGIASVYNSAGALMTTSNDLATALTAVQSQSLVGATIKLTAGTYHSTYPASITVACTIQGTDADAGKVILQSTDPWSLTGATSLIDKVTVDASAGGLLTMGGGVSTAASVTNSTVTGGVLTMSAAGANATNTLTNDTFPVATGGTGLVVKAAATVTGSTFNIAGTGIGISSNANTIIAGSTFNGTSGAGFGVTLNGGTSSAISACNFVGLTTALTVGNAGAGVFFTQNTVTSCGVLSSYDTIVVTATSGVTMYNNVITKSLNNIINVSGNDNLVVVMLNSFSNNAKNAVDTAGGVLNCTRNYWGGTSNNPSSTANVSYASPLGANPTASMFILGASGLTMTADTTVGVNVTASSGLTTLGAAALGSNPVSTALPADVTPLQYFDVFGFGTGAASATIDFYGTTAAPVTTDSQVYFYNTTTTDWQVCSNLTVNTSANGFVEITIANAAGATSATAPTPAQFEGLPFALVNGPASSTITTTTAAAATTTTTAQVPTTTTTAVTTATTTAKTTAAATTTKAPAGSKPVIPSGLLYGFIAVSAILVIAVVIVIIRAGKS
jgi:hypothetical protein